MFNLNKETHPNQTNKDEERELVEQMRRISEALKAQNHTTKLGAELYEMCKRLKIFGKQIEERHRVELDKFFGVIRQTSCSESAELGLPCRLKVMELLELRGMGWRTNLSSAQYYAKKEREMEKNGGRREEGDQEEELSTTTSSPSSLSETRNSTEPLSAIMNCIPNPIISSPINSIFDQSIQHQSPSPIPTITSPTGKSSSASVHPFRPFVPSPLAPPFVPSFPPPIFSPSAPSHFVPFSPQTSMLETFPFNNYYQHQRIVPNLLDGMRQIGDARQGQQNNKLIPNQIRAEITIRNNDSGKVMGVKGRRVAQIEQISGTVISFQRVDPKCKERQLVISGESHGAIEAAKRLIGETIERNVSPEGRNGWESPGGGDPNRISEEKKNENGGNGQRQEGYKIEKDIDGRTLKIATEDPKLLEVIKETLEKHLKIGRDKVEKLTEKKEEIADHGEQCKNEAEKKSESFGTSIEDSNGRERTGINYNFDGDIVQEDHSTVAVAPTYVYGRDTVLRIRNTHNWDEGTVDPGVMRNLIDCDLLFKREM